MAAGVFRIYTQDDSFTTLYIPSESPIPGIHSVKEYQVALAFARDYDENDKHTNGIFHVYWDENITAKAISDFKKKYKDLNPKVLVSIGQRGNAYPFHIEGGKIQEWIDNAIESLKNIIKTYKLDGIDVYYEHILGKADAFVEAIGNVITNLKEKDSVASIAPPAPLNTEFYIPLYKEYKRLINTVVYQCHTEVAVLPDPDTFVKRFKEATQVYHDFHHDVLVGYSAIYVDWKTLSPIVYFVGSVWLLQPFQFNRPAEGTSIWFVTPPESQATLRHKKIKSNL